MVSRLFLLQYFCSHIFTSLKVKKIELTLKLILIGPPNFPTFGKVTSIFLVMQNFNIAFRKKLFLPQAFLEADVSGGIFLTSLFYNHDSTTEESVTKSLWKNSYFQRPCMKKS